MAIKNANSEFNFSADEARLAELQEDYFSFNPSGDTLDDDGEREYLIAKVATVNAGIK